jgi:succinate-semialdehyde dehydrogenase/glutarate-semialdehyde dehydrogenase
MKISKIIKDKNLYNKIFPYDIHNYQTINPFNNQVIKSFEYDTADQISLVLERSHNAFRSWKFTSLEKRLDKMHNLINVLEKEKDSLSKLITLEMGKPIQESRAEINKSINHIKYYIKNSAEFLHPKSINFDNHHNKLVHEPLGVCLSIVPWNYPLWVGFKSIIPCLVEGNTIIFKPSAIVPQSSIKIADIFKESGFVDELILSFADHEKVTDMIISDKRVRSVVFTGSTRVGSIIAEECGKYLKKYLLELGGSDPLIVFDDADIDKAVYYAAEGRLRNTGQACICSKRIIIHESIKEKFIELLKEEIKKYKFGNPMDEENKLGPISRFDFFVKLKAQVIHSLEENGAECQDVNGKRGMDAIDEEFDLEKGNFFKPIILTNIKKNSIAWKEELFGPVFSLYKFKTLDEAIDIANDTEYGLGASIFTKDDNKADECAKRIESGMVFINSSSFSDSRLPYGGTKNSGIGRTSAWAAFDEFANNKIISWNK